MRPTKRRRAAREIDKILNTGTSADRMFQAIQIQQRAADALRKRNHDWAQARRDARKQGKY